MTATSGSRSRVFMAVTHLLGAGHLTRAAAIGRAFARAGHRVTLATGGMPAELIETHGLDLVQLPPVRATNEDFRSLSDADGADVGDAYLVRRRECLLAAFAAARPDLLLTELYPFGRRILAGEYGALLEAAHAMRPRPVVACSIRDILVAPSRTERLAETHGLLDTRYDAVLVHADPRLVRIEASWPLPDRLRSRVIYTGYVDAEPPVGRVPADGVDILVSGGSSEAALPLYRATLGAAARLPRRRWHVLVGGGVSENGFHALAAGSPPNVTVERARPDFRALMAGARVFVGLAGYNTAVDLLATGTRAVLVPFERGHETEQRLRADKLAEAGLAEVLPERDLSPATLAAAVGQPSVRTSGRAPFDGDGAAATVRIADGIVSQRDEVSDLHQASQLVAAPAVMRPTVSSILRETVRRDLDGIADAGRRLRLWWRDDDAAAATPALERLLGLARRLEMPLALAAVPALVERSLCDRLNGRSDVSVLVHGWSHDNYAAADAKKAEFGQTRALAQASAEIARARAVTEAAFGGRALAVFVPPWNRISPDILSALPSLGFRGVSCFGATYCRPSPRIARIDTHLDPVDWHGTRGLIDDAAFLSSWRKAIAEAGKADTATPTIVGFLSHHLAYDEDAWAFTQDLLGEMAAHATVDVVDPAELWRSALNLVASPVASPLHPEPNDCQLVATPKTGVTGPWGRTIP